MTVYRSGYGQAAYGTEYYGLSGAILDAVSIAITSSTVVTSAEVIKDGSVTATPSASVTCSANVTAAGAATASASASTTSNGVAINDDAAVVTLTSSATCTADVVVDAVATISLSGAVITVAETYAETDGYRTGYGLRTYGTSIYGENLSVEAGAATVAATSTVSVNAVIEAVGAAAIAPVVSVSVDSQISVIAASIGRMNSSVSAQAFATYNASISDAPSLTFTSSARKKWEDDAEPTDTWTDATDDDNVTWTDAPVRVAA